MSQETRKVRGAPADRRNLARRNQLLSVLPHQCFDALSGSVERVTVVQAETLFEPGDDVTHAHFPLGATVVALVLPMKDGHAIEAATVGREGAVGGIVSLGFKPAFARAVVRIPGEMARIPIQKLEEVKRVQPGLHDVLSRYADCLIAQILQSVACAAVHPLEARCARWLLMTHDRLQQPDLPLTQEVLAEMFGVARTYVTRIVRGLQEKGAITHRRGIVSVQNRTALEDSACECYGLVRRHFERVLPGLYPSAEL